MATFADWTTHCRHLLQDVGASQAWGDSQIRTALDTAMAHWTRREGLTSLLWIQGVQDQRHYALDAQRFCLQQGRDTSGTTGNLVTLTDATTDFTLIASVGDWVRNYTDGSQGQITTVAATVLTCAAGFTGGIENAVDTRDDYGLERTVESTRVASVQSVLYDGVELWYASREQLDRLAPQWETQQRLPRYWTIDQAQTPTVITLVPAPRVTGSSAPCIPMAPLAQHYEENLVAVVTHHPQQSLDAAEELHLLDVLEYPLVYDATARLAGFEGEWQHPSLATTMQGLAGVFWQLWEQTHG